MERPRGRNPNEPEGGGVSRTGHVRVACGVAPRQEERHCCNAEPAIQGIPDVCLERWGTFSAPPEWDERTSAQEMHRGKNGAEGASLLALCSGERLFSKIFQEIPIRKTFTETAMP